MEKKIFKYSVAILLSVFMLTAFNVSAQDLVKTNPNNTKLLADTAGVRMIKVTLAPGEELVMHTHPVQMLYCLEGGQLTVNYKNGKKEVVDIKPGDAMQAPSDPPHTTKNTGATTLSFLEIEIPGGMKK
jgi:quercetin dioxygenase-like cupin family protein